MSGDPILHEVLARGQGFGHRQHLELAWRYLEKREPQEAGVLLADAIRKVAAAHGARAANAEPGIRPLPGLAA
ncbi:MAG: hypothetical protein KGL15_10580 [Acidobacteriota bacterium]|nr:hypothetical protein [Acidobacteriota bacterium]